MSFFIQSKLGNLVVDIQGSKNTPGTPLDAFTKKTSAPANANQLWEFAPGPVAGYYFIQNTATGLVIDIEGSKTASGTLLDAFTKKGSFPGNANQLWAFYPAATSGYYLIGCLLDGAVIDVQGGKTTPGTPLDAFTEKQGSPGDDNQLWTFVDTNGKSVTPPAAPATVAEPSGGYHGAGNYIVAAGSSCATLTGIKATIYVTEDLIWESSSNGHPAFSIQLNAETNSNQKLDWLQFMSHMGDDTGLWPWMNIWAPSGIVWNQAVSNPVAKMPQAARIPAGYSLVVSLQDDSAGNVTGATWNVFNSSGSSIGSVTYPLSTAQGGGVPPGDLSPVASYQVTLGGAMDGTHATFSSGAGLMVWEADQTMNVDTAYPSCIGYTGGTAETSNVSYGAMSSTPSKMLWQAFNVIADSPQAHVVKANARKAPVPTPAPALAK
jgi:hypothetical protein